MIDLVKWPAAQWSILDELDSLQDDMSRVFGGGRAWRRAIYPPVNAWLSDDGVILDVELPGVNPDDVDISVVKDELTISGKVGVAEGDKDRKYYRRERPSGEFSRTLRLPFAANPDGVSANYKNGILRISVPRSEDTKPKKIAIEVS